LRTLFETHKTNNERLETRLKEIGRWCEKNLSVEQLKEIFPLKAERIEKELKHQRAKKKRLKKTQKND
ncbi:mobilization protein, partial [Campylobacter jejuni]|nr:mobilization protein [Campylobacter jejuni]